MNAASIKTLPVAELALVAVIYQSGEYEDGESGQLRVEYEYDILNEEAFGRAVIPKDTIRCDCCGHALKYACIVEHTPSKRLYYVGRQCVRTIEGLRRFGRAIEELSVALAERAACNAREVVVLAQASDDFRAAYVWAGTASEAPSLVRDIRAKVRQYGSPSDAQKDLLVKVWREDTARRAAATGTAPEGRQTVSGTILSVKAVPSDFNEGEYIRKVLIDLGNGAKVYGNAPGHASPVKGEQISFTAMFERSKNDILFGFWKRPTKWTVTNLCWHEIVNNYEKSNSHHHPECHYQRRSAGALSKVRRLC